jgi:hypothetical protein
VAREKPEGNEAGALMLYTGGIHTFFILGPGKYAFNLRHGIFLSATPTALGVQKEAKIYAPQGNSAVHGAGGSLTRRRFTGPTPPPAPDSMNSGDSPYSFRACW